MAEPIALATSLISLASLFSTCIECFAYYQAAKECPRQIKTKLVKLEFEKTRLLIWANQVGLVNTNVESRNPGIERHENGLRAVLEQIRTLLVDANKMQDKYGLRLRDEPMAAAEVAADLVSRNSLDTFIASYRRFRGQVFKSDLGPKFTSRLRWAIFDEMRFEIYIKTLRSFVDDLFWLVPVERSVQDQIVETDIMAVTEVLDLEIIRDASEHEYQVWSGVASRVVERT